MLAVDQSGIPGDKTAMCLIEYKDEVFHVKGFKFIEPIEKIEQYMDLNINKIVKEIENG